MRMTSLVLGVLLSGVWALTATMSSAQNAPPDTSHITFTLPQDIKWKTGAAMDQAVIFGDPGKPGIYGVLIRWHPQSFSHPHFHNTDRFAYVISGTWWVSTSDVYDPSKMSPMVAGSQVTDLAGKVHYDGAKDDGALIELVGMGPVTTTPVEAKK